MRALTHVNTCGLCACGSGSVCERETVGEGSSNSCVGMSACIGSDSLVGMSACVGSNSLVGMSACVGSNSLVGMSACVGSNSLVGMSACVGSDSLVGMSACGERPEGSVDLCERLRDQSFCVFGPGKSIEPSSQRFVNARETCCIARAFGTMMRMLLIWLLVFSTEVGVGCDYVGAPPKRRSQADFATSHPWVSLADYPTSFIAYHGWEQFIRKRVATGIAAYHLDVNAMRSYSASRVAELAKEAGPTLGLYKRIQIQSETPMYVVSLVDCYTQKGWLETQLNLPTAEGLDL